VQSRLLPQRKAAEQLGITSYKMTVHMILSYPLVLSYTVREEIIPAKMSGVQIEKKSYIGDIRPRSPHIHTFSHSMCKPVYKGLRFSAPAVQYYWF